MKRFYLQVDHSFDAIWSATLVTDFTYVGPDGHASLFVKKAYVQGKFNQAAVFRIGSASLPWIPLAERYYGMRYVEKTLVDRLKYGHSTDWGLHLGGDIGQGRPFNYAVSVVNGAGYKQPDRSNNVDVEARVGVVLMAGMIVALGAYQGTRGLETGKVEALHTATRADVMLAYAKDKLRVGGEYFQATNWGNVLTPARDKAAGWSVWGSVDVRDSVTIFARYDHAKLSKQRDPGADDIYFNAGVQFQVAKGFKLAAVYKHEQRDATLRSLLPATVTTLTTREIGVWAEVTF